MRRKIPSCDSEYLALANHVYGFDAFHYPACRPQDARTLHGPESALYLPVIGFNAIVAVAPAAEPAMLVHGEFVIMPPWASEIIRENVLSIDMTSTSRTH